MTVELVQSDEPYSPPQQLREPILEPQDFMIWFSVVGVFVLGFLSGMVFAFRVMR